MGEREPGGLSLGRGARRRDKVQGVPPPSSVEQRCRGCLLFDGGDIEGVFHDEGWLLAALELGPPERGISLDLLEGSDFA